MSNRFSRLVSLVSRPAVLAALACGAALPLQATLAVPDVPYKGYINGMVVLYFKNASYYARVQSRPEGADDSAWANFGSRPWIGDAKDVKIYESGTGDVVHNPWTYAVMLDSPVELRARMENENVTDCSDWVSLGSVTGSYAVAGTTIGIGGTSEQAITRAFDGDVGTFVDAYSYSDTAWVGKKFAQPTRILGIRFIPRGDSCRGRYGSSRFEVASDETFSDATVVYTCPSDLGSLPFAGVYEVRFDTPITCGAARHIGGWGDSTTELEFMLADPPWQTTLSVTPVDLEDFHAVATWTVPTQYASTRSRLLRRMQESDAYAPVTDWIPSGTTPCVTNDDLYVSQPYQYVVEADFHNPSYPSTTVCTSETPVVYCRLRRLDRSWSDLTKLSAGRSIMPATDGTAKDALKLPFDGKTTTWPDYGWTSPYPKDPIGIDFGEDVWIGGVGYVCRPGQTGRMKNGALYCASGDDAALSDERRCSPNFTEVNEDSTYCYQAATNSPLVSARCWYIRYVDCHNVPEAGFFGYTQSDVDAVPIVTAPTSVTFAHAGSTLTVSWSGARNATTYALERRALGADAWTKVAEGLTETSYADTLSAAGRYEYRVTATGAYGSSVSSAFGCAFYLPAAGTGLRNAVWSPFSSTNADYRQSMSVATRGVEAVDLDLDGPPVPGLAVPARLVWTGRIICPFAGDYAFTLDTDGGAALFVDGSRVCANWTANGATISGTAANLTVGEHAIRVEYRMAEGVADAARCSLAWGGVVLSETVPATQLLPDDSPASPELNGWRLANFYEPDLGQVTEIADGFTLQGSRVGPDASDARQKSNRTFLYREGHSFDVSAKVLIESGQAEIAVRNRAGDSCAVCFRRLSTANDFCIGAVSLRAGSQVETQDVAWTKIAQQTTCYLRLKRRAGVITAYWKQASGDDWTELCTWTGADVPAVGTAAAGFTIAGAETDATPTVRFTEISAQFASKPGVCLFIR